MLGVLSCGGETRPLGRQYIHTLLNVVWAISTVKGTVGDTHEEGRA
jgi:hypothetical protein